MLCKNCGTVFEGNYCPNCGTKASPATGSREEYSKTSTNYAKSPKACNHTKTILFIAMVVLIVIGTISAMNEAISNIQAKEAREAREAAEMEQREASEAAEMQQRLEQHYIMLAQEQKYHDVTYKELFDHYCPEIPSWTCSKADSSSGIVTVSGNYYNEFSYDDMSYSFSFYVSEDDIHLESAQCHELSFSDNNMEDALYNFLDYAYMCYSAVEIAATTTLSNQTFSYQIWNMTCETSALGDQTKVYITGELTNKTDEDQHVFESELFKLNNNGAISLAYSTNYNLVAAGSSMEFEIYCLFPLNANRDFNLMELSIEDGNTLNLGQCQYN